MSFYSFKKMHSTANLCNEDGQQQLWVAEILQLLKVDLTHVTSRQNFSSLSRECIPWLPRHNSEWFKKELKNSLKCLFKSYFSSYPPKHTESDFDIKSNFSLHTSK